LADLLAAHITTDLDFTGQAERHYQVDAITDFTVS
jgi:hypothetical protein